MDSFASDILNGYLNGYFPMGDEEDGQIYWYNPDPRAIIPLDTYKPSKSLKPVINKGKFTIKINHNFKQVITHCSQPRYQGDGVWISPEIIDVYSYINKIGYAHSVEAYLGNDLVGGLYGISLGQVFFGESMFHLVPDASKIAFHFLIERLREKNFQLLDTQFMNDNVKRFGAIEIPREEYLALLSQFVGTSKLFN